MNIAEFYERMKAALALPPAERYSAFAKVHRTLNAIYVDAVSRITPEQAAQSIPIDGDDRTMAQIVGHIGEWDRYSVMAGADMLTGVRKPRAITHLDGYVEHDGRIINFESTDAFNAHMAEKHLIWPWEQISTMALQAADALIGLYVHSGLMAASHFDNTEPHRLRLPDGEVLEDIKAGWFLWFMELQHIAVDHRVELGYDD